MLVNLNTFKGQNKAIPAHMLPEGVGQYANNMYIEDGRFVPMYCTSTSAVTPSFTGTEQTIYNHRDINNSTNKWFTSTYWTQVTRHPNGSDIHQRIYFIEDSRPKYKLYSDAYIYDLLLPLVNPQDQLTVSLSTTGSIRRFLAYTLVTDYGDESTLSLTETGTGDYVYGNYFINDLALDTTLTITWDANTIIPTGGNYNNKITKIRFYMTPTESTTDTYRFVGEANISDETIDILEAGSDTPLLEILATPVKLTYDVFNSTNPCISLCKTMYGSLVLADRSNTYFSDVYQPATHNATNVYSVDSEITGVFPFGSSIAVFTKTVPSIFTGNGPSTMTVEKAEQSRAVSNIKCVVNTDDYIVFPTDEGIYVIGTGVYKLATDGIISKRQWEDLTGKGSLLLGATHYKDQYILLLTTGVAYIFDFLRGFFSQTTFANPTFILDGDHVDDTNILKVSYYDSVDQQLYGIPTGSTSNSVFVYEGSDIQLVGTFKSKRYITSKPFSMKYLRVLADNFTGATVTINIYCDGTLFQSINVSSEKIYKLKSQLVRELEVEIISNVTLRSVLISDNIKELQNI